MISIVIVTYRQLPRLKLTLRNVVGACAAEGVAAEVVVVDDAAEPEVESCVRDLSMDSGVRVTTVRSDRAGRSGARNCGARAAVGDRLLFLDGDVLVGPGTLAAHADLSGRPVVARGEILRMPWLIPFEDPEGGVLTSESEKALGALGKECQLRGRTVKLDDQGYPSGDVTRAARRAKFERDIQSWLGASANRDGRWLGVTGAHFSIESGQFAALGGFDEAMGRRWGAEDLEFGYRAERAGIAIEHLPGARVYHMDHGIGGRGGDHEFALRYFADKHARPGVLRLLGYFAGECGLAEVAQA